MVDDGGDAAANGSDPEEHRSRRDAAVVRFTELVTRARPALDGAALQIALAADPRLDRADADAARVELDRLADDVTDLPGLVHRLYGEAGFAVATEDYYDPRHSSLIEVVRRRRGIPVTLAVVCLEVGRRAGVALEPVGMPGHFLLRVGGSSEYLDPATGALLDVAGCERRFRQATGAGPQVTFDAARLLAVVDRHAVLVRMLTNLRAIHRAQGHLAELRWVLAMRLALPWVSAEEVLELAEILGRRAAFREAAGLLEEWAEELPGQTDRLNREARAWRAHLN